MITGNLMARGPLASGNITSTTAEAIGDPLAYADKNANSYLSGAYIDPTSFGIGTLLAIGLIVYVATAR